MDIRSDSAGVDASNDRPDPTSPLEPGTALITGGSGYFGSALAQRLIQQGWRCRNFDLIQQDDTDLNMEFHLGDIRDYDAVVRACDGVNAVFHCVAQVPLARDRTLLESVNIEGTTNVVKAAFHSGEGVSIVIVSSSAIYGVPTQLPVTESTPHTPRNRTGVRSWRPNELRSITHVTVMCLWR